MFLINTTCWVYFRKRKRDKIALSGVSLLENTKKGKKLTKTETKRCKQTEQKRPCNKTKTKQGRNKLKRAKRNEMKLCEAKQNENKKKREQNE